MMEYIKSWLKQGIKARKCQEVLQQAALTAIIAMSAKQNQSNKHKWRWDTDSSRIHVDNCASYSISNDIKDFMTKPKATNKSVKGISGTISQVKTGTILWYIEDDNGKVHAMVLPGSLYIPESPSKLFSPQHWAQVEQDQSKTSDNQCITYADRVVLLWDNGKSQKHIPIKPGNGNVASMFTAPGYAQYADFCANAGIISMNDYDKNPEVSREQDMMEVCKNTQEINQAKGSTTERGSKEAVTLDFDTEKQLNLDDKVTMTEVDNQYQSNSDNQSS